MNEIGATTGTGREAPAAESAPGLAPGPGDRHPFSGFVRTVGRGTHLSRPLDEDEARAAMRMILAGAVEPVQLGALLVVLRYRKETPAELAGFVRAARECIAPAKDLDVDLDWPSYADRHRQNPYFILAALLLAGAGVRIAMHGIAGESPVTTPGVLAALGIAPSGSIAEAGKRIEATGFAYLPLDAFCPALDRLFGLRPMLGVRTAANTFARDLNPLGAAHQIQGVFHPTYLPTHRETARRLGLANAAIFKGGGGEAQRNPEKPCRIATLGDGETGEEIWPALTPRGERHPWRDEPLTPGRVVGLWRGDWQAPGPVAAVVGSAAIALRMLGRAAATTEAEEMARAMWAARPCDKYGDGA